MTTDASPVNRYLLFDRADSFRTTDKVVYALQNRRMFSASSRRNAALPHTFSTELERFMLIRSLEELKRGLAFSERIAPMTPSTGNTFTTNLSAFSSPELATSPQFDLHSDGDAFNYYLDGGDDLDGKPWDITTGSQANFWSWPIEVLFQSYHLWIALDFGRDVFSVTRNGNVLVDRIPTLLSSLLEVVETMLHARRRDVQQVRNWIEQNIFDEALRHRVMQQLWDPRVVISIVLLNAPQLADTPMFYETEPRTAMWEEGRGDSGNGAESPLQSSAPQQQLRAPQCHVTMYPPEHRRYTVLESDDSEQKRCSAVTILSRCDAHRLLSDAGVINRLRGLLARYETVYRAHRSPEDWPRPSLSASIEYLIRAMPESSAECNTIVFVSNVGSMKSSETLSFLQSTVRRKNIIVSLVALNRALMFESPELSPLAGFLSAIGGFAVHIDYWLALATHRLNAEWCHRFEGARCLAQQIFVHLTNGFPVAIAGATRRDLLMDAVTEPIILYDSDRELPDFVLGTSVYRLVCAIASLRFNEGWSVLVDYTDDNTNAHIAARYTHHFHRGSITLHYEANVNRPAVYRRMLVFGTKALVDTFCKYRCEDGCCNVLNEGNGHWLMYLALLRMEVQSWIQAEQTMVALLNTTPRQLSLSPIANLSRLTSAEGIMTEWLNIAHVSSTAVFFHYAHLSPMTLLNSTRGTSGSVSSIGSIARSCIRAAMERHHRMVGREEDLTYLYFDTPGSSTPLYLVQFFALSDGSRGGEFGLAGGYECRVSSLLCSSAVEESVMTTVLDSIIVGVRDHGLLSTRREKILLVDASVSTDNTVALQLVLSATSQRRFRLLSRYTEGCVTSSSSLLNSTAAKETWAWISRSYQYTVLPFPWALSNALCYRCFFGCCESYAHYAAELLSYFVLRRLSAGFKLLVYHTGSLKAVLMKTLEIPAKGDPLSLFDVVEAHTAGPICPTPYVCVYRLVTPFKYAKAPLWTYIKDIQEDLHVATALYTCRAFSNASCGEKKLTQRQVRDRGMTVVLPRVESLLYYLKAESTEVLELNSPPFLGDAGTVQLRDKLLNLVSCVGDRCAVVPVHILAAPYLQLLTSGSEPLDMDGNVYIAVLNPIRYHTIIFLLLLESDSPQGTRTNTVRIAIAALDGKLLEHTLTQQYQLSLSTDTADGETAPTSKVPAPECVPDKAVVQSLRYLMTTFASIYGAKELIAKLQCSSSSLTPQQESAVVAELVQTYEHLGNYATEIDATHLLRVVMWRYCGEGTDVLHEKLREVFADIAAAHLRTFASHPTLLLQGTTSNHQSVESAADVAAHHPDGSLEKTYEECGSDAADSGGLEEGRMNLQLLPVAMKICGFLERPLDGDAVEENCIWVESRGEGASTRFNSFEDSTEWTAPAAVTSGAISTTAYADGPPSPPFSRDTSSMQLKLRVFVRTVPADLLELCKEDSLCPSQASVRSTLRVLIYRFTAEEAMTAPLTGLSSTSTGTGQCNGTQDVAAPQSCIDELFRRAASMQWSRLQCDDALRCSLDFSSFPQAIEVAMTCIVNRLAWSIATYCLTSVCYSSPFLQLQTVVMGSAEASGVEPADAPTRRTGLDCAERKRVLAQPNSSVIRQVLAVAGLKEILREVVTPAMLSSRKLEVAMFPVEFTQQATSYRSVDPVAAALDVFRRCVEEDHICVLPTTHFSYIVVPNAQFFGRRWLLAHLELQQNHTINRASVLCYDERGTASRDAIQTLSEHLRTHIYTKITQVSQLHLLKQLRDTQNASAELIPPFWGDQFRRSNHGSGAPNIVSYRPDGDPCSNPVSPSGIGGASASFYLRGRNVLEIPIYYKLQHQCSKIASRILTNSSRLELITIFNRNQCFVVADDVEGDTFHYIRLVFVKDMTLPVSVAHLPPPVLPSDRCPQLVVQLFSATSNPLVTRPLQRLQDFCYFLAVQELQGHLNYVQHKVISFNDLVFLQHQKLDPLVIDLHQVFPPNTEYSATMDSCPGRSTMSIPLALALSLLFLNMREYKFKPFEVQDERTHATSNFVEHYNLEKKGQPDTEKPSEVALNSTGTIGRLWRFVKMVDGLADVLTSCCVHLDANDDHVIVLDRFLTKIPAERYINGESESATLAHLSHCIEDTVSQLRFFALSKTTPSHDPIPKSLLDSLADELLKTSQEASTRESSVLRFHHFPLDNVSPAIFPLLVERLCGTLSLYNPICFTSAPHQLSKGLQHVPNFAWQWVEFVQNDPLVDQMEVLITCGYQIMDDSMGDMVCFAPTRVLPITLPGAPITTITTSESQASVLKEYGLDEGSSSSMMYYRVVMKVSLLDGISIAVFNLRDAEYVLRLLGHVTRDMEEKSALLDDVLLQRMGYAVPSAFVEDDLARNCCGDRTNIIGQKPLSISTHVYRRRVNHVRCRAHPNPTEDDPIVVLLEGLYNRGLIVNYEFPIEDAIKVLYDECPQYSLAECARITVSLLDAGILNEQPNSALKPQVPVWPYLSTAEVQHRPHCVSCRLAEPAGVPADALIACSYHRHILAAHIIVEAQNARSGVAEVLATCDMLWRAGPQNNVLKLAKSIVTLQLKSKEVFGARVPDFSLRRERWQREDDLLDPTLPTQTQQNLSYARGVDASLQVYMEHLRQLYPSMCVIDLDPNDPLTTADEVLLNRLRCRYGKVTNEDGEVVLFSPHLYYAVISFVDLLQCRHFYHTYRTLQESLGEEAMTSPITTSGVFIIEVGFQVVNYALDFFVINGERVPPGVTARVAADFKQTLHFDSVLYDTAVRSLSQCMRTHSVILSGQQKTFTAITNLAKYHPFPPLYCANIVSAYVITDARVMRLKNLPPSTTSHSGDVHVSSDGVLYLLPQKHNILKRERTQETYSFCGLIIWERAQLFVLLANTKDINKAERGLNRDLAQLVLKAKQLLLTQLLDSTQQERRDAAWRKFLVGSGSNGNVLSTERDLPSFDELELLRSHSHKIVVHYYVPVLQLLLEAMEWTGDARKLYEVSAKLYPHHILHVIGRQKGIRPVFESGSAAVGRHHDHPAAGPPAVPSSLANAVGGFDPRTLFTPPGWTGIFVVTFAATKAGRDYFLALECTSDPLHSTEAAVTVEDLSLYCKPSCVPSQHQVMTFLGEEEQRLVEDFVRLISNVVWSEVVPCPSQFML